VQRVDINWGERGTSNPIQLLKLMRRFNVFLRLFVQVGFHWILVGQ